MDKVGTKVFDAVHKFVIQTQSPYAKFTMSDYDDNCFIFSIYRGITDDSGRWYHLYFARFGKPLEGIATIRLHDKISDKHITNQLTSMILDWVSKTRIKKPKEKKCDFKYLDEDEARINKASENLGMKFEPDDDHTKEDNMAKMTKDELEQKYWEAQRRIDEYERERDRFLKAIEERDQSINDLMDANENLLKENNKLSANYSRMEGRIADLNDENTRLNNDILSLQDESQDDIADLKKRMSAKNEKIDILVTANEKLEKENDRLNKKLNRTFATYTDDVAKLGSELDKAVKKHDAATEKCKELAKDVEFWKGKAYEMDKKNCEFRSRNRELEKELDEEKSKLICKVEITPDTCYQIDMLARKVNKLENEKEELKRNNNNLGMKNCELRLFTQRNQIEISKLEEENVELRNALEAADLRVRNLERMKFFDESVKRWMANIVGETDNKKKSKEFKKILVRECFGRPYYEILYKEDGQMHVGYSSYKLDNVSEWLKEFFID